MQDLALTPIAILRESVSGTDAYGSDTRSESVLMTAGVFAPGASAEIVQGGDVVTTQPTVYLRGDVVPLATDVAVPDVVVDGSGNPVLDGNGKVQGTRYQVDGDPSVYGASPLTSTTSPLPVTVPLRKVTG